MRFRDKLRQRLGIGRSATARQTTFRDRLEKTHQQWAGAAARMSRDNKLAGEVVGRAFRRALEAKGVEPSTLARSVLSDILYRMTYVYLAVAERAGMQTTQSQLGVAQVFTDMTALCAGLSALEREYGECEDGRWIATKCLEQVLEERRNGRVVDEQMHVSQLILTGEHTMMQHLSERLATIIKLDEWKR